MNESIKAVLAVVVAACALTVFITGIGWMVGGMTSTSWSILSGGLLLGLLCTGVLVWAQTRKDKAPDFLRQVAGQYFERDGFCFTVVPQVKDGRCFMAVFFQNRYSGPAVAQILIRASSSLSGKTPDLADIALGVACGPGAFGCSTIPWPVPSQLQGKKVSLSLYAGVKYLNGRGQLLRYRDGLRVGSVNTDFWREGLQIVGAIAGSLVISRPAKLEMILPTGVVESRSERLVADTKILWKMGDVVA